MTQLYNQRFGQLCRLVAMEMSYSLLPSFMTHILEGKEADKEISMTT